MTFLKSLSEWINRWPNYFSMQAVATALQAIGGTMLIFTAFNELNHGRAILTAFCAGLCASGAIYNLMIMRLLKLNNSLMEANEMHRSVTEALMQMKMGEIGRLVVERLGGVVSSEISTTKH